MLKTMLTLCLVAITCGTAVAEVRRLSLPDAIKLALEKNGSVRAASHVATAAGKSAAMADSAYYPKLSVSETFTVSNAPTQTFMMKLDQGRFTQQDFQINELNNPGTSQDFRSAIVLQQPLYNPATRPATEMAYKEAEKQALGLAGAKEDAAFGVFRSYLEVQRSQARHQAAGQAIEDARANLRLATVRTEAGIGLRSDELRARTNLATAELRQLNTLNNLTLAKLQLALVVGLDDNDPVAVADRTDGIIVTMAEEDLFRAAVENRPDLKQLRADLDRATAAVSYARSDFFPRIDGVASYQINSRDLPLGSDNSAWIAGVTLNWQLFDGFRSSRDVERASSGMDAAREILDSRVREVRLQVRESFLRREETGKRLEVARRSLQDAEETVRLLMRRFENSLATMVELLDAETVLNQARADLADTEAGYILASGQVYHAAGTFLQEMLK
jgi:outer membrane protein TolC